MTTTSVKLMLLTADAIWTISSTTKHLILLNFLSGQEGPGAVREARVVFSLRLPLLPGDQVFLQAGICPRGFTWRWHGASWTLLFLLCLGPLSPGTPLPWDSSPMGLLRRYNLLPHPVPEPKDETRCPAGTTEEPKGYLLAEGKGHNVLKVSMSNNFGSISYMSPWYFSGTSMLPTTSAHYHCTGTKLEYSSELEQKDWWIPQRRML